MNTKKNVLLNHKTARSKNLIRINAKVSSN